jgi:hypothetical protein
MHITAPHSQTTFTRPSTLATPRRCVDMRRPTQSACDSDSSRSHRRRNVAVRRKRRTRSLRPRPAPRQQYLPRHTCDPIHCLVRHHKATHRPFHTYRRARTLIILPCRQGTLRIFMGPRLPFLAGHTIFPALIYPALVRQLSQAKSPQPPPRPMSSRTAESCVDHIDKSRSSVVMVRSLVRQDGLCIPFRIPLYMLQLVLPYHHPYVSNQNMRLVLYAQADVCASGFS